MTLDEYREWLRSEMARYERKVDETPSKEGVVYAAFVVAYDNALRKLDEVKPCKNQ